MRQFLAVAFTAITAMLTAPIEARVFTADDFSFKPANDACRKLPAVVPKDLVSALPDDVASVQWVDVANDGRCDLFALTRGGDMNHPPLVYFAKRLDTGFDQPNDMSGNAQVIPVYPKDGGPPFLITRAGTAENPYPRVEFVLHWNASRSLLDTGQDQTGESILSYQKGANPKDNANPENAVFWLYIRNEINNAKTKIRQIAVDQAYDQLHGVTTSFIRGDKSGLEDLAKIYAAMIDYANAYPFDQANFKGSGVNAAWVIHDDFIAPQRPSAAANFVWGLIQEERAQNPRLAQDYLSSKHFPESNALTEAIAAYRRCLTLDEKGSLGREAKRRLDDLGSSPPRMHARLSAKDVLGLIEATAEAGTPGAQRQADSR